ncbi:hypothetical protein [Bacillus pseudomycoides]|uniref:hypothetical protein n=1 Tax=Bacillus pseudomycoides TaxID=64104 RepID=UPI000BFCF946|nr:hypothetical protein [Bacillus pseudomycoides]PGR97627.1 hypothetical protein COC54_24590 [Bacillus pseudomycoides]
MNLIKRQLEAVKGYLPSLFFTIFIFNIIALFSMYYIKRANNADITTFLHYGMSENIIALMLAPLCLFCTISFLQIYENDIIIIRIQNRNKIWYAMVTKTIIITTLFSFLFEFTLLFYSILFNLNFNANILDYWIRGLLLTVGLLAICLSFLVIRLMINQTVIAFFVVCVWFMSELHGYNPIRLFIWQTSIQTQEEGSLQLFIQAFLFLLTLSFIFFSLGLQVIRRKSFISQSIRGEK